MYNHLITEENDGQNYENKTQVVINLNGPLNAFAIEFALALSPLLELNFSFAFLNCGKGLTSAEAVQRETEGH